MTISDLSDTPQYSIKTVCAQTGIRAVTLRAWERRYHLLTPSRTPSNYRLYSKRDVAVLRWLKQRIDEGVSISRAVAELAAIRATGHWPELVPTLPPTLKFPSASPPTFYPQRLYEALVSYNEFQASQVLNDAQATFDLLTLCNEILTPCLVQLGVAWERGEIRVATEHFASNFLRGRLLTLFQALLTPRTAPRIMVGAAPGEMHDIGALMLSLFLRQMGYRVEFLGPDVYLEDLLVYARDERPAMLCLSANSPETAQPLAQLQAGLNRMRPRPKFGFGGAAFNKFPDLCTEIPGLFLGNSVTEGCHNIQKILGT